MQKSKVDSIIKAGKPWSDPEFPPTISSLGFEGSKNRGIQWKRIGDIYSKSSIFKNGKDPSNIDQG